MHEVEAILVSILLALSRVSLCVLQDTGEGGSRGTHQHQLCRSPGPVRPADGHRQRESGDGRAAHQSPDGHQGRTATRHLGGVCRGRRGAAGPRGQQPQDGRSARKRLEPRSARFP